MTETQKNQLKKICKKVGADYGYWERLIEKYYPDKAVCHQLLGFLLDKENLQAWWGNEMVCHLCGEYVDYDELHGYGCPDHGLTDPQNEWKWHGQCMIGLTLAEMLEYFEKYEAKRAEEQ